MKEDGTTEGYYTGHGDWGPIIGVGYYPADQPVQQGGVRRREQHRGHFVVAASNGGPLRADDLAGAVPLELGAPEPGVIETESDVDEFRFNENGVFQLSSVLAFAANRTGHTDKPAARAWQYRLRAVNSAGSSGWTVTQIPSPSQRRRAPAETARSSHQPITGKGTSGAASTSRLGSASSCLRPPAAPGRSSCSGSPGPRVARPFSRPLNLPSTGDLYEQDARNGGLPPGQAARSGRPQRASWQA